MKQLPLIASLLFTIGLSGQQSSKPVLCGNEIFSDMLQQYYPQLYENMSATFEGAKYSNVSRSDEPLTIRVIAHVVWKEEVENLHDSIILNQIEILNDDFNRLNADTLNLRTIFYSEAGTANIHFELAEIVRVQTEELFVVDIFGTNLLSEVKHTADGGSDAWDTEAHLNIWITHIQPLEIFGLPIGQILGFAFPPNGLENWPKGVSAPTPEEDGVVLDYRIVGSNNPNTMEVPDGSGALLTIKGRSATHEVGHYLGLRHIWGDGGLLGPNDCLQSDGIDDTPFADSQSAFDCDKNKNSCSQIEPHYEENIPDLVENFMDYAAEDCMNMFTNGQVSLMRNVLMGPRSGLINEISGVRDLNERITFSLTPNPASDVVHINFDVEKATEIAIRISDIGGHLTLVHINQSYLPGSHHLSFSVDGFTTGMYLIELRTAEGVSAQKLVIE